MKKHFQQLQYRTRTVPEPTAQFLTLALFGMFLTVPVCCSQFLYFPKSLQVLTVSLSSCPFLKAPVRSPQFMSIVQLSIPYSSCPHLLGHVSSLKLLSVLYSSYPSLTAPVYSPQFMSLPQSSCPWFYFFHVPSSELRSIPLCSCPSLYSSCPFSTFHIPPSQLLSIPSVYVPTSELLSLPLSSLPFIHVCPSQLLFSSLNSFASLTTTVYFP